MMRDFANWALETAKVRGATYADARVMDIRHRDLNSRHCARVVGFRINRSLDARGNRSLRGRSRRHRQSVGARQAP
jgi:hypothetical protein